MKVIKCDRCGKLMEPNKGYIASIKSNNPMMVWKSEYDLCDECEQKFREFVYELGRCDKEEK